MTKKQKAVWIENASAEEKKKLETMTGKEKYEFFKSLYSKKDPDKLYHDDDDDEVISMEDVLKHMKEHRESTNNYFKERGYKPYTEYNEDGENSTYIEGYIVDGEKIPMATSTGIYAQIKIFNLTNPY